MDNRLKLLYVDDEAINLLFFEMQFRTKYEVLTASGGIKGLSILEQEQDVVLIISDMNMPNMTGLEFINKAKAMYPGKKFCILTGYEITEEIRDALKSGIIIKYFSKPFRPEDIERVIEEEIRPELGSSG